MVEILRSTLDKTTVVVLNEKAASDYTDLRVPFVVGCASIGDRHDTVTGDASKDTRSSTSRHRSIEVSVSVTCINNDVSATSHSSNSSSSSSRSS